jgi:crotonobetainyl-CoA:carnitine CoA-transferase CaiB-like acyl-CoA transferase
MSEAVDGASVGRGLLAGVRVLDLSLLGPAALASHFVDFGAEVIKIEAPSGDYVREMTWPIVEGVSLMHLHINRGKESLVLDLKTPEAMEVFTELVAKSDVIIEAMRPGFLDKRGFTRERLEEINPAIVFCSISGYGATGPYRDLPAHGIAFDTWAGQIEPLVDDDGFCYMPDQANIGITAGPAFGAMAVLAALVRARTTGKGAHMEIAQSDAAAYFDWYRIETFRAYQHAQDFVTGNKSDGGERRKPGLAGMREGVRYQLYESADGHVLFMASEQAFWKNFCAGIGRDDLFEQFPGSKYADHARGNVALHAVLREIFRTRTSAEWLQFAGDHNTPIAPVHTPNTVIEDPQFKNRFTWTTQEQTGIEQLMFPLHIDGEQPPVPTEAPTVGQHSETVLRRVLGYDDARIAALRAAGATV